MRGATSIERITGVLLFALATCCNGIVRDMNQPEPGDAADTKPNERGDGGASSSGTLPRGSGGTRSGGPALASGGKSGRITMGYVGTGGVASAPRDAAVDGTNIDAESTAGSSGNGGTTNASGGGTNSGGGTSGGAGTGGLGAGGAVNNGCAASEKFCDGTCVPPSPRFGCGAGGCGACSLQPPNNGYVTCANGACVFDCLSGYTKQGGACVDTDIATDSGTSSCNPTACPACNAVDGPACCTTAGKCGCPAIPYVSQTCAAPL